MLVVIVSSRVGWQQTHFIEVQRCAVVTTLPDTPGCSSLRSGAVSTWAGDDAQIQLLLLLKYVLIIFDSGEDRPHSRHTPPEYQVAPTVVSLLVVALQ